MTQTLKEFIGANKPQPIVFDDATLNAVAEKLGLKYIPYNQSHRLKPTLFEGHALFTKGEGKKAEYFSPSTIGQPQTFWVSSWTLGENQVVYSPTLWGSGLVGLGEEIRAELAVEPVWVLTPELIIELPIPEWVSANSDDYAWLSSQVGFASELKPLALKFAQELLAQFGE
jgi:hypothetical protein